MYGHTTEQSGSSQPTYLRELFTIQPTRSARSSSCLTLSRTLVTSHIMFSKRAISITAPRLWNDLPPELRTIPLPPPPSLLITTHPPPLSITDPGFPLKIKMSSLQTLLLLPILSFTFTIWTTPTLNSCSAPPGILEIEPGLLLTPLWKKPFDNILGYLKLIWQSTADDR